jgi:microcystin-dependent protein
MSAPFVAEIRIWACNFAPTGWAFCDGQLMPISQNTALFSLLGTTYGGDGKTTFALPNLQGANPMHQGQGQGLSLRDLGEMSGVETVTLIQTELPAHSHFVQADAGIAGAGSPAGAVYKSGQAPGNPPTVIWTYTTDAPNQSLNPLTVGFTGGNLPHNNMQPYLTLNFCIALQGVFPPRG